jgi:hypothetical protein
MAALLQLLFIGRYNLTPAASATLHAHLSAFIRLRRRRSWTGAAGAPPQ